MEKSTSSSTVTPCRSVHRHGIPAQPNGCQRPETTQHRELDQGHTQKGDKREGPDEDLKSVLVRCTHSCLHSKLLATACASPCCTLTSCLLLVPSPQPCAEGKKRFRLVQRAYSRRSPCRIHTFCSSVGAREVGGRGRHSTLRLGELAHSHAVPSMF